jgi:hypothetical protein
MRPIRRSTRVVGWVAALVVLTLATTPQTARAQFPGYGWGFGGMGYGYPAFGYGMYGSPYGMYGSPYGFGYPGGGFGYGAMGYGYGIPGYGYGYPGLGYGMGYGYGYWAPALAYGNFNPLFGVGLTPLAVESYNIETNVLGRRQYRPIPGAGAPVFRQVR